MDLSRTLLPNPYDHVPALAHMAVRSRDFHDGDALPQDAGLASGNVSPSLEWEPQQGASALLISCFDVDAPVVGGFLHWAAVLPGDTTNLPKGAGGGGLPVGSIELRNDYGSQGWGGCAPPEGDVAHRYYFAITALGDESHGIDAETPFAKAQFLNLGNMRARGVLMGTYRL